MANGYLGETITINDGAEITFEEYVHPWTSKDWLAVRTPERDYIFQGEADGTRFSSTHYGKPIVFVRLHGNKARVEMKG